MSSNCGGGCHGEERACGAAVRGPAAGSAKGCLAAADALLAQASAFIEALDDASYARTCALASGGTIGKHVRHCVDHYAAAIGALASAGKSPIDYDHRERDVPMETCRTTAMEAIARLREELARACDQDVHASVTVRVMVSGDGGTADFGSTVGRELAFAAHHALHHHAMMKFIADSFGCLTPSEFGKAPSTMHHERRGGVAVQA